MKYALIINGVVDTIALDPPMIQIGTEPYQVQTGTQSVEIGTDPETGEPIFEDQPIYEDRERSLYGRDPAYVEAPDDVFGGFAYDGEAFTAPPPAPPAPITVTPYQTREALRLAGQLDEVEALVNAQGGQVYNAWHYAPFFREDHEMIVTLSAALGWSADYRHELFVMAKELAL